MDDHFLMGFQKTRKIIEYELIRISISGYEILQCILNIFCLLIFDLIEMNVFFFQISQFFEIWIQIQKHLLDSERIYIHPQTLVIVSFCRIIDLISVLEQDPTIAFQKYNLSGILNGLKVSIRIMILLFQSFPVSFLVSLEDPVKISVEPTYNVFDDMERIQYQTGVWKELFW